MSNQNNYVVNKTKKINFSCDVTWHSHNTLDFKGFDIGNFYENLSNIKIVYLIYLNTNSKCLL